MRWRLLYTLTFLGVFLTTLVAQAPAAQVYAWLPPLPVQLYGLSGTLWQGRASALVVSGRDLGRLAWELHPAALLTGELAASIDLQRGDDYLLGRVRGASASAWSLEGVEGRLDLAASWPQLRPLLQRSVPQLAMFPFVPTGELRLFLSHLAWQQGPEAAEGRINWLKAGSSAPQAVALGDLSLELESPAEGGVVGRFRDAGGPLRLDGGFRAEPDGAYRSELKLRAADGAPTALVQGVSMLGRADNSGWVSLTFNGRL